MAHRWMLERSKEAFLVQDKFTGGWGPTTALWKVLAKMPGKIGKLWVTLLVSKTAVALLFSEKGIVNFFFFKGGSRQKNLSGYIEFKAQFRRSKFHKYQTRQIDIKYWHQSSPIYLILKIATQILLTSYLRKVRHGCNPNVKLESRFPDSEWRQQI